MTTAVRLLRGWHLGAAVALLAFAASGAHAEGPVPEVVVTGVSRPLQLILDGTTLVVLGPGARGDAAGEIYRVDLDGQLPVDLSRQPRLRIPFAGTSQATLGSLALDPATRDLFVGEENGVRIYRLGADGRLTFYATGLHRLAGGGTLAFDDQRRLVVLDYVDPRLSPSDEQTPPGLEQFRDEDYRGPLVFRLALDSTIPLPRRLATLAPLYPRAWGGRQGGAMLPRLISVLPVAAGEIVVLSSRGELFRVASNGALVRYAVLPPGQYNRTTMTTGPDGSVFVSGGFHVGAVFSVTADGRVSLVARDLADPEGIAVDPHGVLYVAESSLHRIVRVDAGGRGVTRPPPSRP
jgi:NHL repeat-containing protein